ncbi:MAG: class I adenylate-forming enzyme family protein [Acidimicrobiia bacterium]
MSAPRVGPLHALLDHAADAGPARPALTWNDETLTYERVRAASGALAAAFGDADLQRGERVAIVAPNLPALVVAMFATWRAGAVAVPVSARLREHDLTSALELVEPAVVVSVAAHHGFSFSDHIAGLEERGHLRATRRFLTVDALGAVVDAHTNAAPAAAAVVDADIGLLMLTSGTTGAPRAALVSHERELTGAASMAGILGLTESDTTVVVVPGSHAFGLTGLLAAIRSGGHAVLVDSTMSPEPMVRAIERWEATIVHGSPTLFSSLAKFAASPPPSLRAGFVAGARCPPELIERLADAGMSLLALYGMTEIGAATTTRLTDPWPARRDSVGRPLPSYDVRIVDGEVQVSGPCVTTGYFGDPVSSAELFDGAWLRTGDLGELDADGNLHIVGRRKELANIAGFTVAPAETETVLLSHPDVLEAVVVAVPDPARGEALHAFVVTTAGAEVTNAQLLHFARRRLAGYKLPYSLEIVAELPVLASGKPDRAALRARARK